MKFTSLEWSFFKGNRELKFEKQDCAPLINKIVQAEEGQEEQIS